MQARPFFLHEPSLASVLYVFLNTSLTGGVLRNQIEEEVNYPGSMGE